MIYLSDPFPKMLTYLCNIKLIFLFSFYRPTFTPIHCWSYSCGLKFSLKLEWYFFFFLSQITLEALHHFFQPASILSFTSLFISLSFWIIDSRYLNRMTSSMVSSSIFTSKFELLRPFVNLHHIYSVLHLLL